jgi:prepilin-type N-terminal cleavage/methylation domain-containing protein
MKTNQASVNCSRRGNEADRLKCSNKSASSGHRLQARSNFETIQGAAHAFTFIELLVVVVVLAFLVCVFASARAASRPNSQGALCLNNLKQMMAVFPIYSHDYSDFFLPNWDSTSCSWAGDNEAGWMPPGAVGSADAGNPDILKNPTKSLLTPYVRTNISLFRCPFDPRICPYSGADPKLLGQKIPTIRGISMNAGVGTKGSCNGANPNVPVDGP